MDLNEVTRRPVFYEDRYPDELNPRRTPERGQGYSMGKLIAERAFAEAAEASGRWDAITCCPGDNVGPIQSAHQKDMGPWQHLIEQMLEGHCRQTDVYRVAATGGTPLEVSREVYLNEFQSAPCSISARARACAGFSMNRSTAAGLLREREAGNM